MKEICVSDYLHDTPRPHYLNGTATLKIDDKGLYFQGSVTFPSSRDSIEDRINMPMPHVNVADAYFGLWNAMHLIADHLQVESPLQESGSHDCLMPIPADTPMQLEISIANPRPKGNVQTFQFAAHYRLNRALYMRIYGTGSAKERNS